MLRRHREQTRTQRTVGSARILSPPKAPVGASLLAMVSLSCNSFCQKSEVCSRNMGSTSLRLGNVCKSFAQEVWGCSYSTSPGAFSPIPSRALSPTLGLANRSHRRYSIINDHRSGRARRHLQPRSQPASGQRLRATLAEYAISFAGFAELLRISPQCLTNWFARGVPQVRMEQLARLLSVSEQWLATGEGKRAHEGFIRQPLP